jgi:hypothetical protein
MTPCKSCPWHRAVKPGALGGSPPEVYIGQIVLPFWLPCHNSEDYCGKQSDVNKVRQCVGAATFRTNIGLTRNEIREPLSLLPENKELVFSDLPEFYAHHYQIPVFFARQILTDQRVAELALCATLSPNVRTQFKLRTNETTQPTVP